MLVGIGWLKIEQLQECQKLAQDRSLPLDALFAEKQYLTEEQIASYLQKKFEKRVISKAEIATDESIMKMLPDDFVEKKRAVILSIEEGNKLGVAMMDPNDKNLAREISLSTGRSLNIYALPYHVYEAYLKEYFIKKKAEQSARETERIIRSIEEETAEYTDEDQLWAQVEKELQDTSGNVAKFVYKIITDSIDAKASDIHIEPRIGYYVVRVRHDGILKKVLEIPSSIEQAVITRFKVLARMNIAEHRRPQDGTFTMKYNDKTYDFRLNTLPVGLKEKMVIRILAPAITLGQGDAKLSLQGATDEDIARIERIIAAPNGILLASGPTSGSTPWEHLSARFYPKSASYGFRPPPISAWHAWCMLTSIDSPVNTLNPASML